MCRGSWLIEFRLIEFRMIGYLFFFYREFSVKILELMFNVEFLGGRECNKDDFFGFERLKVDDDNLYGRGSI